MTVLEGLIAEGARRCRCNLSKAVILAKRGQLDDALSSLRLAESSLRPDDRRLESDDPLRRILRLQVDVLTALGRGEEAEALRQAMPAKLTEGSKLPRRTFLSVVRDRLPDGADRLGFRR